MSLKGKRVRLVKCEDPYTNLQPGDEGVVDYIDSVGTVHVTWDNGIRLGLVTQCGDEFEVLPDPEPELQEA